MHRSGNVLLTAIGSGRDDRRAGGPSPSWRAIAELEGRTSMPRVSPGLLCGAFHKSIASREPFAWKTQRKQNAPRKIRRRVSATPKYFRRQTTSARRLAGHRRLASRDASANPAKSLGVGDALLLRDPLLTNGLRVRCRPAIGQQSIDDGVLVSQRPMKDVVRRGGVHGAVVPGITGQRSRRAAVQRRLLARWPPSISCAAQAGPTVPASEHCAKEDVSACRRRRGPGRKAAATTFADTGAAIRPPRTGSGRCRSNGWGTSRFVQTNLAADTWGCENRISCPRSPPRR